MGKLVKPTAALKQSYLDALKEFQEENVTGFWLVGGNPLEDFDAYLQRAIDFENGINLPERWVQSSTFWLVDDEGFIGHTNIRHILKGDLHNWGGHIGYHIRPSRQRQGHGTRICELALQEAKLIGHDKVLLTCVEENIGSRRIIEKNGGVYQDTIDHEQGRVQRFWITLP